MELSYAFDDILIIPSESDVLPSETNVKTYVTNEIELRIPIISAAMDTVTEAKLAIALAQHGGIGCIHKNLPIDTQLLEVRKVKKYESWIVYNPIAVSPDDSLAVALSIMQEYSYSGIPVVTDTENGKLLVGILTNRDVRFVENKNCKVSDIMTKDHLITVPEGIERSDAIKLLHQYRKERLIVVDNNYCCVGLITVKDIEKFNQFPNSCKDSGARLRVAAAVGTGPKDGIERAEALIAEDVDIIVVDTAHGHSQKVLTTIKEIKTLFPYSQIIGGNIATAEGAHALIEAGVDAVKVGIGPGSICTTRIVTGVGVPQFSAILNVANACKNKKIKVIADGGIKYSGDIAKSIAAGADVVMIGSIFAGTDESPGEIIICNGRAYKSYRGMGSVGAMKRGSASRYFQENNHKFIPEGIEGRVPLKGPVAGVIHQLVGGLRSAMGYTGNRNISEMKTNCKFTSITSAGLRESHVHDVIITREASNYDPIS
ncbi:inosine-5'-monophosphate dehydrogenase [Ehrlichia chaffeensis str. Heartland]|uniref:IMP dehydrogenase n=1 Tax=Ehrlichia chaffeensis TaxID=945 RepID=UPI000444DFF4|nr:IMP dehydrogenase [Ehrlichia chaffeensis]AHX03357.1 inosine-5'-monophosphate dehydrogenase [Ehrlichia chaffeensis str. Heartland]AHX05924.1 inosine-5'-monophosphate dehydrogenase [Ehrlichia chaffeensis str. Jax]AHX06914.1 inosine-5'-monophosphate dehydrogenase [Ehrlichia chaffeensis str. Liberty]AHX07796.1 inosine-5'-monophosphate dehydrogenase [Ehrlichia chaffeensis str. Osceola]AHX08245.1 inosine-5'-monophosphate dehydrogenase [Ehrlichia chaffeensis str. Saint Vincent]